MSAECGKCGTDIVYPPGTWPVGECPVCAAKKDLYGLLARTLPIVGAHPRGFAQELLAEIALALDVSPYDYTSHPETLTRRIALLPVRKRKKLERRKVQRERRAGAA